MGMFIALGVVGVICFMLMRKPDSLSAAKVKLREFSDCAKRKVHGMTHSESCCQSEPQKVDEVSEEEEVSEDMPEAVSEEASDDSEESSDDKVE